MTVDRPLCTKQIADRLGCSTKTVSRRYHAGKLPGAFKLSRTSPIKIVERDLQKYIRGKG